MKVHIKWNYLRPILSSLVRFTGYRLEKVSYNRPFHISAKVTSRPRLIFQNTYSKMKQTSDYECTHQMELFDTHFV